MLSAAMMGEGTPALQKKNRQRERKRRRLKSKLCQDLYRRGC
jgi:hypothetical protein